MKYCPRCGNTLLLSEKFCSQCGTPREEVESKAGFPWRTAAITVLIIFLILGTGYLVYERLSAGAARQNEIPPDDPVEFEEPLIGKLFDERPVEQWDYYGGVIEESVAYDENGNLVTIYRDRDSGALQGYWVSMPPAAMIALTPEEAEEIAVNLASQLPVFRDPQMRLLESTLVDLAPGAESYYYFFWAAQDEESGAVLLRQIEICVHPENGRVIYVNTVDGGAVEIETNPAVTEAEARETALHAAGETFHRPRVEETVLAVTIAGSGQQLVWQVYLEETGDPDRISYHFCVIIDAINGEIIEIEQ